MFRFVCFIRGAQLGWITGDLGGALKPYLLVGGLGACVRWVGARLWRSTCGHDWRAAFAAHFLAESVGVLRGAHFG